MQVCARDSCSAFDTWVLQRHFHCERFTLFIPSRICWIEPSPQHEAATAVIRSGDGLVVACRVQSYGQNNPVWSYQMKSPQKFPLVTLESHTFLYPCQVIIAACTSQRVKHHWSSDSCLGVIPSLTFTQPMSNFCKHFNKISVFHQNLNPAL